MRLRSFTAASLPEAMQLVRRELGPDAVILSTQESPGAGVQIMAGLDDDPQDELASRPEASLSILDELRQELEHHRIPAGLSERLLQAAAENANENPQLMLAAALDSLFRFADLPTSAVGGREQRTILLMGPCGAGKTATAAKLCAHARLSHRDVCLISMDTVSAGAREQVDAFARAVGVPLLEAADASRLREVVASRPRDQLLIVDTIGVNPFDDDEREALRLAVGAAAAYGILVLPAGGDAFDSAETAAAFSECGAQGLIATRIDAARRFGGLLTAAQAGDLTFFAAGIAPSIGSGLYSFNPVALARLLMPESFVEERDLVIGTHS